MKNKILRKLGRLWNNLKVLMNMDMRVFDDPATLIGGAARPETATMVREAHARAGVPTGKSNE